MGLSLDPGIDGHPRLLGCSPEVQGVEASANARAIDWIGGDGEARLWLEGVGHAQVGDER